MAIPGDAQPYQHFARQRLEESEAAITEARARIIRLANGNTGGMIEALDSLVAKVRENEQLREADKRRLARDH